MPRPAPYRDAIALPPTARRIARWLLEEITARGGFFAERTAALEIIRLFGGRFVRATSRGEFAVGADVVAALRKLAGDRVRWDRTAQGWRLL